MISELGVGAIVLAWIGSLELRIKNHVGKDRFNDLKEQSHRIEKKVDALLIHNKINLPKNYDKE